MKKQLVFIDDSGDPGFKSASSSNFVMAATLFTDPDIAEAAMHEINEYRQSLGWQHNHELKFAKNPKKIVTEILRRINKYNFSIYAVYIDKKDFREITPAIAPFFDKEKLYNWTIKELLKETPLQTAKITIDGRSSKQHMKNTKTYLNREIGNTNTKKLNIKFEDSATTDLLQLADLVAGSINRSLQPNKTDSTKHISIIKSKVAKLQKLTFR